MQYKRVLGLLLIGVLAAISFGCATLPKETDRAALLKATAEKYWHLRLAGNYKEAYKMEDGKGLPEFDAYREKAAAINRFSLESSSIEKMDIQDDKAVVTVVILFTLQQVRVQQPFRQVIYDNWIFRDGAWLHQFPTE